MGECERSDIAIRWPPYFCTGTRARADSQMMKKLNIDEGQPVRLNGTVLPKGKLVKIQAQSTDFLEVSDPKAV
jgi:hypothetical protein